MAFGITIKDRISFGNCKAVFVEVTDAQDTGSSFKIGQNAWSVKAVNNTDSSDTFKEAVGAKSSASTRNQVTFTPATSDDDGMAFIIYN